MVLLKNDGATLPFDAGEEDRRDRAARAGAAGHGERHRPRATTCSARGGASGRDQDAVTPFDGHQGRSRPNATYTPGCTLTHNELYDPAGECPTVDVAAVTAAANAADQVVLALGETREMSGEAEARIEHRPARPPAGAIIDAVKATGKPFAVVLFNGRPLTLLDRSTRLAGDPRGLVRRHRGRQRRRRRRLRQGQPGRQAAGELPAQRRPDADLLQPRADRAARATRRTSTTRATATSRQLRAAVRVRLRPQLHDLQGRPTCA